MKWGRSCFNTKNPDFGQFLIQEAYFSDFLSFGLFLAPPNTFTTCQRKKQYIQPAVSHGSPTCSVCPREAASSALACCPVQQPGPPTHFCSDSCENDSNQFATVTLIYYKWCTYRLCHECHTHSVYSDLVLTDDGLCKDYLLTSERHDLFFVSYSFSFLCWLQPRIWLEPCVMFLADESFIWTVNYSHKQTSSVVLLAELDGQPTRLHMGRDCQHQRRDLVFTHYKCRSANFTPQSFSFLVQTQLFCSSG